MKEGGGTRREDRGIKEEELEGRIEGRIQGSGEGLKRKDRDAIKRGEVRMEEGSGGRTEGLRMDTGHVES